MSEPPLLQSDLQLPQYSLNLAQMLNRNASDFSDHPIYQEIQDGEYAPLSWNQFRQHVISIQYYLESVGLRPGDRMAILSPNRQEMLELELAVMAMGGRAVPIFAGYSADWADRLVEFCEPKFVAVADESQYDKMRAPDKFDRIIHFDALSSCSENCVSFTELLASSPVEEIAGGEVASDEVCLMMYTSGTMGKPKCVQLTHSNILSQQAAMRVLWQLSDKDRFLSYLPWHHSFGGIFEKYAAICNGAVLSLENSFGKDTEMLMSNWRKVRPTVFFSVPRIYQNIATLILQDEEIERLIFHDELRFVFTAAAPLPKSISDMFESRQIPVYEGWGLTETSPCCTVTDPHVPRKRGVVGKSIPGITLKLEDDGEILVKGPNVMKGYFNNPEETRKVLAEDGWFRTGDVGECVETGLRLIARKDRIFKLSNAEKVVPTEIESLICKDCAYLAHAFVTGNGRDYPVALLFPNSAMFCQKPDESQLMEGCQCPQNLGEYFQCLNNCLMRWNDLTAAKYARLKRAMLIDHELTIEDGELTPSMKLAPNIVAKVFKAEIESLYDSEEPIREDVFVINLGENQPDLSSADSGEVTLS